MIDEEHFINSLQAGLVTTIESTEYLKTQYHSDCQVAFEFIRPALTTAVFRLVSSTSIYFTDLKLFIDKGINYTARAQILGPTLVTISIEID